MSTLTLSPRLFDSLGALLEEPVVKGPTLEDVVLAGWRRITSGEAAPCPVCHGEMRPVWSAGARPVGARCQDCGSRLS